MDFDAKVEVLACNELCPAFVSVKWCYILFSSLLGAFPSIYEGWCRLLTDPGERYSPVSDIHQVGESSERQLMPSKPP